MSLFAKIERYFHGRNRTWYARRAIVSAMIVLMLALSVRYFLKRVPLRAWQHDLLTAESSDLKRHLAQQTPLDDDQRVDGILVLGYSVNHGAEYPTDPLVQRLETAYQLACVHSPPVTDTIIVTGGSDWRVPRHWATEADVMAKWLRERAANDSNGQCHPSSTRPLRIILERESTSTRLNAANAMMILHKRFPHIRHLILVTNRFHQWRALRVFQQVARELFPLPSSPSPPTIAASANDALSHVDMWHSDAYFSFVMAPMKLDSAVPQWDFWRELLAMALYRVMRWV